MHKTLIILVSVIALLPGDTMAHPPWGIAVDKRGHVYFSDLENVWEIDTNGRRSMFRAGSGSTHTHEITLDHGGNLIGEDLNYEPSTQRFKASIWKVAPSGSFSYLLPPTVDPPTGSSIWRDLSGNSYFAGTKDNADQQLFIIKRSHDGKISTLMGDDKKVSGFRQVIPYSFGGSAFGTDGSVYVTDRTTIYKITAKGTVRDMAPNTSSTITSLTSLSVDNEGNVYASDFGSAHIFKVSTGNNWTIVYRSEKSWSPTGVAYDKGALYILEYGFSSKNLRVVKRSADGKVSVLTTIGDKAQTSFHQPNSYSAPRASASSYKPMLIALGVTGALAVVIWRIN